MLGSDMGGIEWGKPVARLLGGIAEFGSYIVVFWLDGILVWLCGKIPSIVLAADICDI